MNRFEFFDIIPAMSQQDRQRIQWAYAIAKKWHEGQWRDGGERYFEHVRRAALILIQHGYTDAKYIICLLLHDLLEDTFYPLSMLEPLFGAENARGIVTVSKTYCLEDPLTGFMTRIPPKPKEIYFPSIQRNGVFVALAKCADRIENQSDLIGDQPEDSRWTPEKRIKQVGETREWIIPLADMFEPRFSEILERQCSQIEVNVARLLARAP